MIRRRHSVRFWSASVLSMGGGLQIVRITGVLVPFMRRFLHPDVSCGHVLKHRKTTGRCLSISSPMPLISRLSSGGFAGSAMSTGESREVWSSTRRVLVPAPNAAAAANVRFHPVKQGLVQMLSVFIDTILICTATGDDVPLHRHRSVRRTERRSVRTRNLWERYLA